MSQANEQYESKGDVALVKTKSNLMELFKANQRVINAALAGNKFITPAKLASFYYSAVEKNPKILNCSTSSVIDCLLKSAQVGLEVNTANNYACVVPYKGVLVFIIEYRGVLELAYRSGEIAKIEADVVYAGDDFSYQLLPETIIRHIPNYKEKRTDDKLIGAWVKVSYKDTTITPYLRFYSRAEIEKHQAKAQTQEIWNAWKPEMYMKTAIHIIGRWLPRTPELQKAIEAENQSLEIDKNDITSLIDPTSITAKPKDLKSEPLPTFIKTCGDWLNAFKTFDNEPEFWKTLSKYSKDKTFRAVKDQKGFLEEIEKCYIEISDDSEPTQPGDTGEPKDVTPPPPVVERELNDGGKTDNLTTYPGCIDKSELRFLLETAEKLGRTNALKSHIQKAYGKDAPAKLTPEEGTECFAWLNEIDKPKPKNKLGV